MIVGGRALTGRDLDGHVHAWVFGDGLTPVPPYSTDLASAWLVVDEMRKKSDGHFTLLAFTTEWRAGWLTPGDDDVMGGAYARFPSGRTPAEAICRAGLVFSALPGWQSGDDGAAP